MTGGAAPGTSPPVYDLAAPTSFPPIDKESRAQLAIPEATAPLLFDTQRILVRGANGESTSAGNGQWSDSLPKLFQAKIIQSFENARYPRGVSIPMEGVTADFRLLIEIRDFQVVASPDPRADVEFAAKLLAEDGHLVAQRLFHTNVPAKGTDVSPAAAALNAAFCEAVTALVLWVAHTI
jgi:phospholipid/cholesterol/gamma-HCH transport system substrate-binding protein